MRAGLTAPLALAGQAWRGEHHILVTFLLWGFAINTAFFVAFDWAVGGWGRAPAAPWAAWPLVGLSWLHMGWWSVAVWRSSARIRPLFCALARVAMLLGWLNGMRALVGEGA